MAQDPKEKEQKRKEDKARKDVKEKLIDSNPINKFIKKILPKKEKPKDKKTKTKTEKIRVKKEPIKQRRIGVLKMKKGGMPDLTGDGKITRADVLKGRGVFKHGGTVKKMKTGGPILTKDEKRRKKSFESKGRNATGNLFNIKDRNYLKGR